MIDIVLKYKQSILVPILFTGLGLFSHFLLINWNELSLNTNHKLVSPAAYSFTVGVFNLLGFLIIRLSRWIESISLPYSLRRIRLPITYTAVALILLALNYTILVSAKLLIGASNPLFFPNGGGRMLIIVWLIELIIISLLLTNRSINRSMEYQREAARLQQENEMARYAALQHQLNPHFLFNSLNTLVAEIEYNPANAVRFTRELSDVYRYVLQSQQRRMVLLSEEILFLESYIYLHRVRMGDCIVVEYRVGELSDGCKIAPLSLQLLAENVIKHNVISEEHPMRIVLEVAVEGEFLTVSNDYRPKLSESAMGIGLNNLSNRYQLLCGRDVECRHDSELFCVKLPLIYD